MGAGVRGRPICVMTAVVIGAVLFFYPLFVTEKSEYRGEEKELLCRLDAVSGMGADKVLTVTDVMENGKVLADKIKVYNGGKEDIFSRVQIGNIISVYGKIYSFSEPGNPGQFNEKKYYRELGIDYKMFARSLEVRDGACDKVEQFLQSVRQYFYQILQKCLPPDEAGVVAAMVLGEKCGLSDETRELYQENGVGHLLAISGLHISLIGAGLFFFLRRFVMPMRPAALTAGVILILYCELIGFPVSAQRAVTMMLCVFGARFLGMRYDLFSALSLSALIQLCLSPGVLFQSGFLLSYGTVFGIGFFLDVFQKSGSKKNLIWRAVSGSLGISLVTFPVMLYFYYEISPYSVLVNVVLLPFVSMLISMSAAGGAAACVTYIGGKFLFGVVHVILRYYDHVCRLSSGLPMHRLIVGQPESARICLYYFILIFWRFLAESKREKKDGSGGQRSRSRWDFFLLFAAVVILVARFPVKDKTLTVTALDVGQGDCICIRTGDKTLLVDGGSSDVKNVGKYRISKFLKYYGVGKIDYIFISHSDGDHISGLMEILNDSEHMGFDVGAVVLPDIRKRDENYDELEESIRQSGIPLKKMRAGQGISVGDIFVKCLHPTPDYEWKSENDYSLVLQVEYGSFKGVLAGDLEMAGESEILDSLEDVDYLKIGHHGSKGASGDEFLARLRPEYGVVSAGEGNRYGHPHAETLERLKAVGTKICETAKMGAVTVKVSEDGYEVEGYKG